MVKKFILACAAVVVMAGLTGCSKKTVPTTQAYRSYETECISKDASGSITLRVWGEGSDAKDARQNAAKKAVEEVTFTNLKGNRANVLAIIPGPTVRARHREYFNKFFKDGGKYKKYVEAEKPEKEAVLNGNQRVVVPVIVTVDREGLITLFKKDNVLE